MRPRRRTMTKSNDAVASVKRKSATDKLQKSLKTQPKSIKKSAITRINNTGKKIISPKTKSPVDRRRKQNSKTKRNMDNSQNETDQSTKDEPMEIDQQKELTTGTRTSGRRQILQVDKSNGQKKSKLEIENDQEPSLVSVDNSRTARIEEENVVSDEPKDIKDEAENSQKAGRKRTHALSAQSRAKRLKVVVEPFRRKDAGAGYVLTVGQGDVGQLGLGDSVMERKKPSLVEISEKIVDICAGGMHTMCLSESGKVFSFGCNDEGALGRDTSKEGSEYEPGVVNIDGKIIQISAGDSHSAALTDDGRVFVWGTFRDSSGSMGLLTNNIQTTPHCLLVNASVAKIASGNDHLAILTTGGHLYTCGCAEQGQLGRVAECFTSRGGRKGLGLLLNPGLAVVRRQKGKELLFDDVWTGSYSTFVRIKDSTDVYVCGLNNYYQLGSEKIENHYVFQKSESFSCKNWKQIFGGQHHTLALSENGDVYALGRKEYGRLGLGNNSTDTSQPTLISDLSGVECVDIACGVATSYAVAKNGTAYAWGMGTNCALGTGDEEDKFVPTPITGKQLENRHVIAVSSGGQHAVLLVVKNDENLTESNGGSCAATTSGTSTCVDVPS